MKKRISSLPDVFSAQKWNIVGNHFFHDMFDKLADLPIVSDKTLCCKAYDCSETEEFDLYSKTIKFTDKVTNDKLNGLRVEKLKT
jgi:hypothetical protein